jgi:hypothetical protein
MPEELNVNITGGPKITLPSVTEAAMQTLDVLLGVTNVLEKMWSANIGATYNIEVDTDKLIK